MAPSRGDGLWRKRVRIGTLVGSLIAAAVLMALDWLAAEPPLKPQGIRLLSANANGESLVALEAIRKYSPDIVALQETGRVAPCAALSRKVGYHSVTGSGLSMAILEQRLWRQADVSTLLD